MILLINACVRSNSRTRKLADALLSKLEGDVAEVDLGKIDFPVVDEAFLAKRDELERVQTRMNLELSEFAEYFPEVEIGTISDDVWEKVKAGASLSASYALYLRKNELQSKKIDGINEKNRQMSAGSVLNLEGDRYYSPSEVKRMSPAQIKANYDDILESMKHWN